MANTKSAQKCIRKMVRKTERNRMVKTGLKTAAKKFKTAVTSGDSEASKSAAVAYSSALDKAAKRGIIHANKASRQKKGLSKFVFATS